MRLVGTGGSYLTFLGWKYHHGHQSHDYAHHGDMSWWLSWWWSVLITTPVIITSAVSSPSLLLPSALVRRSSLECLSSLGRALLWHCGHFLVVVTRRRSVGTQSPVWSTLRTVFTPHSDTDTRLNPSNTVSTVLNPSSTSVFRLSAPDWSQEIQVKFSILSHLFLSLRLRGEIFLWSLIPRQCEESLYMRNRNSSWELKG